ncbi:hypothetical protein CPAR01_06442 [Colletotrichum paranaense]|uniref:Uncharacterized protein n=1 Tax=Colletotrichum paranaense TaxID=1914294 RepID=A0ABQ9SLQ4_9PEZI|nr:uncharacterized protein CPAR01_06442 [Colletotrichum paranaense]KAK1540453.1 hypothetical protein CPAR01_06442 [Colletotrichum paranaense]
MTLYQIPTESFDEVRTVLMSKLSKICRRSLGFDGTFQKRHLRLELAARPLGHTLAESPRCHSGMVSHGGRSFSCMAGVDVSVGRSGATNMNDNTPLPYGERLSPTPRFSRQPTAGSLIKILRATTTAIHHRHSQQNAVTWRRLSQLRASFSHGEREAIRIHTHVDKGGVNWNQRSSAVDTDTLQTSGNWSVAYSRLLPDAYNGINFQLPFPVYP